MAHFNISMHIVRYQPSGIIFYCDSLWSLLFFSLIRLRPASKLFPYTTLFRSRVVERDVVRHQRAAAEHLDDVTDDVAELDRKSTRLNSSHANSSYAVFCLKKKIEETARCQQWRS